MTDQDRQEFFDSGRWHLDHVLRVIRRHLDSNFTPLTILDFGCGVGRLLIPFAEVAQEVIGLDVSPSMLEEAKRVCDERKLSNVRFIRSDDSLSGLSGTFDLIHSYIVFQHIPFDRGREIFSKLLQRLRPGGIGAIHFLYSKSHYSDTHGLRPLAAADKFQRAKSTLPLPGTDPEMQMNPYGMTEILFLMQRRGVTRFYAEFSDHGGELGIFIYFQVS